MDYLDYSEKFRKKALIAGYSESEISYYLNYAKPLFDNNLPVIYNTSHLAALTGYSTRYIKKAVLYTKYFYRTFYVLKKNGKKRTINEPLPSLKEIQLWINENILRNVKPSKFAKAYIKNKSILDNVKYHKGKKHIYTLDVKDFFPSISTKTIESFFYKIGYSDSLSNLLAKLCCLNGGLAQGAPTSPALSNLILYNFDEEVGKFAVENDLRYTRYADDLTFSFNHKFNEDEILNKVNSLLKLVIHSDLKLNHSKTKLLKPSNRQIVTGIVVNEFPQAPKNYRKEIRKEVYYINKFGLKSHLNKINEVRGSYLFHLLGKINYVLAVNPHDNEIKIYKKLINDLISSNEVI